MQHTSMARSLLCHLFCEHVNLQCAFVVFPSTSFVLSQTPKLKAKFSTSRKWTKLCFPGVVTETGNWVGLYSSHPCATSLVTANPVLLLLFCLPCTGRCSGGFWSREKHPEFVGKHPEFGAGPKFEGFWGSAEGVCGNFGGILGRL